MELCLYWSNRSQQAITFAKRAHSQTDIGKQAVSVSYAAVELGKKIFGQFDHKHVLVLGAGKMSELTAKHLHGNRLLHLIQILNNEQEVLREYFIKTYPSCGL